MSSFIFIGNNNVYLIILLELTQNITKTHYFCQVFTITWQKKVKPSKNIISILPLE